MGETTQTHTPTFDRRARTEIFERRTDVKDDAETQSHTHIMNNLHGTNQAENLSNTKTTTLAHIRAHTH